eukprot:TRINITY_DN349_c2_g1_i1.p1 TRINITY_DN349_c2_g1~~TRINITY_DN349_c2_g1_i1.p1  ORF type:complete len:682 (+),score=117.48 TRINITY_DN349_c2_g1_i1:46-2091(+)
MTHFPPDMDYLKLLSEQYPNRQAAATEVVNLETIISLPKGTEHFLSDIHGEYEAFHHVLRSCSGVVKRHISEMFPAGCDDIEGTMNEDEQSALAALIYYPSDVLQERSRKGGDLQTWYKINLNNLTTIAQSVASKYTTKHVQKACPSEYEHMIMELLDHKPPINEGNSWTTGRVESNKESYYTTVLSSVIESGRAPDVIITLANLIGRLAVDHLHIVGDIYDRGPAAHDIMEELTHYHSVDIQWGNHDMLWMGAAAGSEVCLCTTVRIALRYSNMATLEDAYGIAILPLAQLALHYYADDEKAYKIFKPKKSTEKARTEQDMILLAKMQKAIAVIQFKLEAHLVRRQPEFLMDDRIMLHTLDKEAGTIVINGKTYPLNDTFFPTIDPKNPHELTPMERYCLDQLQASFKNSRWLQRHMNFLWSHGEMYTVHNGNLLLHGALPMKEDGSLEECLINGKYLKGKAYCDALEEKVRQGITSPEGSKEKQDGLDMMYYLWTGAKSPLFGKGRMTTFERYFIDDKKTHSEPKDPYLKMRHDAKVATVVLKEFGCDPSTGIIVNGHTPVKVAKGESPIKSDGKLIVIDGGFSKAYQKETGIAGYTLISNSYGMLLAEHKTFKGKAEAITRHADNHAKTHIVRHNTTRMRIKDTDKGVKLMKRCFELKELIKAYESGTIRERVLGSKL